MINKKVMLFFLGGIAANVGAMDVDGFGVASDCLGETSAEKLIKEMGDDEFADLLGSIVSVGEGDDQTEVNKAEARELVSSQPEVASFLKEYVCLEIVRERDMERVRMSMYEGWKHVATEVVNAAEVFNFIIGCIFYAFRVVNRPVTSAEEAVRKLEDKQLGFYFIEASAKAGKEQCQEMKKNFKLFSDPALASPLREIFIERARTYDQAPKAARKRTPA
jgi:hypothetical protein